MMILGIDPGLSGHNFAWKNSTGELEIRQDAALPPPLRWDLIVLEFPEAQGMMRNALPIHKQASMLLSRLVHERPTTKIYTPPARTIRGELIGVPSASDKVIRDWLILQGQRVGRGQPLNNEQARDAFMAYLWGRDVFRGVRMDTTPSTWLEPRR